MPSLTGPCEFRYYASSTNASVSVNPPEIVRGFMFGAKGWSKGPRSNGISLTGSEPVLRSGASMSTAYPHSVSSAIGGRREAGGTASSTIEVPAPHRNTNYTSNLDPNLNPTSSDNNDNISVSRRLGKTPFQPLAAAVAIAYSITTSITIATPAGPFTPDACTDCG
ncbi:hypothetical protein BU17DRAFT_101951 [Hysterangium stoloniferum]|nr:hypothetical protein BU17DRAFT_101951 [Hysterangium stoloniferum]